MTTESLTEPAKILLLASLLAKDRIISDNGKAFLKELTLRRDPRLIALLQTFESKERDGNFLGGINQLILETGAKLFKQLYKDCSLERGKCLSKKEREREQLTAEKSFIYGEVDYGSFAKVLAKINPAAGSTFYDLGSGTGKALFVATFSQDFGKCVGVEILNDLHGAAAEVVARYNTHFKQFMACNVDHIVEVHKGSFLDYDWSDGDVVFANSTCFSEELMADLGEKASILKPGAFLITFTKGITSDVFEVLDRRRYKMSWGPATVFLHRRLRYDGRPFSEEKITLDADGDDSIDDSDSDSSEESDDDDSSEHEGVSPPANRKVSPPVTAGDPTEESSGAEEGSEEDDDSYFEMNGEGGATGRHWRDTYENGLQDENARGEEAEDDSEAKLEDLEGSVSASEGGDGSDVWGDSALAAARASVPAPSPPAPPTPPGANGSLHMNIDPNSPMGRTLFMANPEDMDSPQGAALLRRKAAQSERKRRLTDEQDRNF